MKAQLICPGSRPAVALLAESCPLAIAPLLGKCLVEYWIEHLVALGVSEIQIVAFDRPEQIRAMVGEGTRWGLSINVTDESQARSTAEVAEIHVTTSGIPSHFVVTLDHLPGQPGHLLFESYAGWFAGLQAWMSRAQTLERIGQCEVRPGVWVGLRNRIDPTARLLAPCWLGDYVTVNAGALVGPGVVLEDGVIVSAGARVAQSIVGPATFVGAHTRIESSIAHHHTLINWATGSCLRVPDAFWLSALHGPLQKIHPQMPFPPMKIEYDGPNLQVSELGELSAANAIRVRKDIVAAFTSELSVIVIDLSHTRFVDSCGLAALCGLQRDAGDLGLGVRLLRPTPSVHQLIELAEMQHLFDVESPEPAVPWTASKQPAIAELTLTTAH